MKPILPLVLSCLFSCSGSDSSDPAPKATSLAEEKSAVNYLARSTASAADLTSLTQANNDFAFSLFKERAPKEPGNVVLSPYSIRSAFALLYPGATGAGAGEIAKALDFPIEQAPFHESMKGFQLYLDALQNSEEDATIEIKTTNNVWLQEGRSLQSVYLDTIKSYYNAGINILDFQGKPAEAVSTINGFIEDATKGLIKDLLQESDISADTTLVLTNSVYMLADWLKPFDPNYSQTNQNFTQMNGTISKATMMKQAAVFPYFENSQFQALSLPYAKKNLAMLLLLPKSGQSLTTLEASLDSTLWASIHAGLSESRVNLAMPKFSFSWGSQSLKTELQSLGLDTVFEPTATNFASLLFSQSNELTFIQDVVHQVKIIVDEKGTEAAAATSISVGTTSAPIDPPKEFLLDHAALFAIYDSNYKSILFLGRLNQP